MILLAAFVVCVVAVTLCQPSVSLLQYPGAAHYKEFASANPCMYPSPNPDSQKFHTECRLPLEGIKRYNICDYSGNAISFSEVHELVKLLDGIALDRMNRKGDYLSRRCVCQGIAGNSIQQNDEYCWYRFGFAFLQTLELPQRALPLHAKAQQVCGMTNDSIDYSRQQFSSASSEEQKRFWAAEDIMNSGTVFASLLRQRWNMVSCGEDVLILVVRKRPAELVNNDKPFRPQYPIVFMSYGEEVDKRVQTFDPDDLRELLNDVNKRLDDGFPLQQVLKKFLQSYTSLLAHADAFVYSRTTQSRANIPMWAIAVFTACALLLLVMALGTCLLKPRPTRRDSASRAKPADASRKWKAGFVGGMFRSRAQNSSGSENERRSGGSRPSTAFIRCDQTMSSGYDYA